MMRIIVFSALILFISAQQFSINGITIGDLTRVKQLNGDFDVDDGSNPFAGLDEKTRNCFKKIIEPSIPCTVRAIEFWNVNITQVGKVRNSRPNCCANWEVNACLVNNAERYCTEPGELNSFMEHIKMDIVIRNAYICSKFRSESNICKIERTGSNNGNFQPEPVEKDESEVEIIGNPVKNCVEKVTGPSAFCLQNVAQYWQVTPVDVRTKVNSRSVCCAIYQINECLMNRTETYCTPDEIDALKEHIDMVNAVRDIGNCSRIPSYSNTCNLGKMDRVKNFKRKTYLFNRQAQSEGLDENLPDVSGDDLGRMLKQMVVVQNLSQKVVDRIDRITINQMVIEMHSLTGDKELEINLPPKFN